MLSERGTGAPSIPGVFGGPRYEARRHPNLRHPGFRPFEAVFVLLKIETALGHGPGLS